MSPITFLKTRWQGILVGVLLAFAGPTVTGTWQAAAEYLQFPMTRQRIEWVRGAVGSLPCGPELWGYQGLISEAVAWDERIVHERESNRHWYSDYFSTDRWNGIPLVELPCQRHPD